jgi:hypothetical protein
MAQSPENAQTEPDVFVMAAKRKARLLQELAQAEVVDLFGVINAGGVGGCLSRGDELWMLSIPLAVWRRAGQPVQEQELTARKEVSKPELTAISEWLVAYEVIHLRARLAENNVFGTPQALVVEIIGKHTSDDELNEQARKLQEPVTFEDIRFGTFKLDRRINSFTAGTLWGGAGVELVLMDGHPDPQVVLAHARSLWDSQVAWARRIGDRAVADLLQLKNDAWLGEHEKALGADQFKAQMTLQSISVYPDGTFEFWHDDGDLFWGHSIMVSGNLKEGPLEAGIHG